MKNTNNWLILRFVSFILLVVLTSSCLNFFARLPKRAAQNPPPQTLQEQQLQQKKEEPYVQKIESRNFDESTDVGVFTKQAFDQLNKENFSWLEQQAAKARKEKETFKGGFWKIRNFYNAVGSPAKNTDEEYEKHFAKLNRWKKQFPKSITARVALAKSWLSYAGEARGGGYTYTVSEEGMRLFEERMDVAQKELIEARNLEERCPQWYGLMLDIAMRFGADFEDFNALYEEAVAFEPDYYYFYQQKAMYLLPRWNGSPGDWENYLVKASAELGEERGAIIYYLVFSDMFLNVKDLKPYKGILSWEKAKQGFQKLKEKYGAEKQRLNEFAKLAYHRINDFAAAHEAFEEIGEDFHAPTWSSKERFEQYRKAAVEFKDISKVANPAIEF